MTLAENLSRVQQRIADACLAAGRDPDEVRLLPVSKTWPPDHVRRVADLGLAMMAENRVQEAKRKAHLLADAGLRWSMIGHVQTNKAKDVIAFADEVQSLDSLRLAQEFQRRLEASNGLRNSGRPLPVYLQVNTSGEPSKFGVRPDETLAAARELVALDQLRPVGLMTIAAQDPSRARECFRTLRTLRDQLVADPVAAEAGEWAELSMGMSGDLEDAIAEGSTVVRIGRAIFGDRLE
ncbi:YggS family pyridoxal phosphate-dependent enzyme [Enemella sp. A6]|uniref:YggS family pyridoxal phosphate-dependent enzyme n=1 Tax=Enemella sp. A6 TaxID=3440152 RepID=UPI003EBD1464